MEIKNLKVLKVRLYICNAHLLTILRVASLSFISLCTCKKTHLDSSFINTNYNVFLFTYYISIKYVNNNDPFKIFNAKIRI